jgi:hypothetical protein
MGAEASTPIKMEGGGNEISVTYKVGYSVDIHAKINPPEADPSPAGNCPPVYKYRPRPELLSVVEPYIGIPE